jgi:hypothetical protein
MTAHPETSIGRADHLSESTVGRFVSLCSAANIRFLAASEEALK